MPEFQEKAPVLNAVQWDKTNAAAEQVAQLMGTMSYNMLGEEDGEITLRLGRREVLQGEWLVREASGRVQILDDASFKSRFTSA